mmetsp:Transcript_25632/g.69535  ORF Transcript_25632/g.69535 Transcript_25632/m.69535 type:complete len:368 (+) Transcript_25632:2524-3627(+)
MDLLGLLGQNKMPEQYQDEDSAVTALKLLAQHALQAPGEGQGGNAESPLRSLINGAVKEVLAQEMPLILQMFSCTLKQSLAAEPSMELPSLLTALDTYINTAVAHRTEQHLSPLQSGQQQQSQQHQQHPQQQHQQEKLALMAPLAAAAGAPPAGGVNSPQDLMQLLQQQALLQSSQQQPSEGEALTPDFTSLLFGVAVQQQQQQQQQQQVSEAVQALDAAVRALAALTSGNQVPQPVFEELLAAGLVKLLKRVLVAPLEAASDSLLGNAALCISHVAARATLLPALCAATQPPTQGGGNKEPRGAPSLEEAQADLVAALLRVAATKGGGTASRNAGIALARMAQNTQMLLRLKELRGLEIIHATARP